MQQLPGLGQMGRVVRSASGGRGKVARIPQKQHAHSQHLHYLIKVQLHV